MQGQVRTAFGGGVLGLDLGPCLVLARAAGVPEDLAGFLLSRLEAGVVAGYRALQGDS